MKNQKHTPLRRAIEPIKATYVWAYDTVAILPDYDDSHEGILPAGALVSQSETISGSVLCDLKNRKEIERNQLPKKRIFRLPIWCHATPLQVVISKNDFETKTELVPFSSERDGFLSWLRF